MQRPTLEVTACIVHGLGTYIFIADETTKTGAEYKADVSLRALDLAWAHSQRSGTLYVTQQIQNPTMVLVGGCNGVVLWLLQRACFPTCSWQFIFQHKTTELLYVGCIVILGVHPVRQFIQVPEGLSNNQFSEYNHFLKIAARSKTSMILGFGLCGASNVFRKERVALARRFEHTCRQHSCRGQKQHIRKVGSIVGGQQTIPMRWSPTFTRRPQSRRHRHIED